MARTTRRDRPLVTGAASRSRRPPDGGVLPFARTGGLAEAVNGLASFQQRGRASAWSPMLPLYRTVRDVGPDLEPVGDAVPGPGGRRTEEARLFRVAGRGHGPRGLLRRAPRLLRPARHLRRGRRRLSGQRAPLRVLRARRARRAAAARPGPGVLHAHDWHTALALVYLRTTARRARGRAATCAPCSRCTTPATRATSRPRRCPSSGCRGSCSTGSSSSGTARSTSSRAAWPSPTWSSR